MTENSRKQKSSGRALIMMRRAKAAASAEVRAHLAAGREVYGRRNGKPVVIKPEKSGAHYPEDELEPAPRD